MTQVQSIPVNLIERSTHNPRHSFSQESLESLANSISRLGVLQPILVKQIPDSNHFELVAGERRWRASQLAKVDKIPAIVVSLDDPSIHEVQLVENLEREQLNPMDEARAFQTLKDTFDYSYADLGRRLKRSYQFIRSRIDLLQLDPRVQQLVEQGILTIAAALELTKLEDSEVQYQIAQEVKDEALTAVATANRIQIFQHEQRQIAQKELRRLNLGRKVEILETDGVVVTQDLYDPNRHHRIWDLCFTECSSCDIKGKFLRSDLQIEDICIDPSCYDSLLAKQRQVNQLASEKRVNERHSALANVLKREEISKLHLQYLLWVQLSLMGSSADEWRQEFDLIEYNQTIASDANAWRLISSWSEEKILTNVIRLTMTRISSLDNHYIPEGLKQTLFAEFDIPRSLFE